MQCVAFDDIVMYAFVCLFEQFFVEAVAETLTCLGALFLNLFVVFGELVFDEYICAITLLRVTVVDQRVVECIYVSGSFPCGRVHENSGINTDNVLVQQCHTVPPVALDVVFEFYAVLTIVIDGSQTIVYLARGEYKAVFLAMSYDFFEGFFLCLCHKNICVFYELRLIIFTNRLQNYTFFCNCANFFVSLRTFLVCWPKRTIKNKALSCYKREIYNPFSF